MLCLSLAKVERRKVTLLGEAQYLLNATPTTFGKSNGETRCDLWTSVYTAVEGKTFNAQDTF